MKVKVWVGTRACVYLYSCRWRYVSRMCRCICRVHTLGVYVGCICRVYVHVSVCMSARVRVRVSLHALQLDGECSSTK